MGLVALPQVAAVELDFQMDLVRLQPVATAELHFQRNLVEQQLVEARQMLAVVQLCLCQILTYQRAYLH